MFWSLAEGVIFADSNNKSYEQTVTLMKGGLSGIHHYMYLLSGIHVSVFLFYRYGSVSDQNKKRMHNAAEKKRKDKIRAWITKIGDLLPNVTNIEKEKQVSPHEQIKMVHISGFHLM